MFFDFITFKSLEFSYLKLKFRTARFGASPLVSSAPNTARSPVVEQFHRSCRNWFWHSATPSRAPSWTLGSSSGFLRHSSRCRGLSGRPPQPSCPGGPGGPGGATPSHLRRDTAWLPNHPILPWFTTAAGGSGLRYRFDLNLT